MVDEEIKTPLSQRLADERGQKFLTVAAMVGLVTAVLAGSAAGLLAAVVSGHVLSVALIAGVLVAIAVFAALIRFQVSTWQQRRSCSTTSERRRQCPRPIRPASCGDDRG